MYAGTCTRRYYSCSSRTGVLSSAQQKRIVASAATAPPPTPPRLALLPPTDRPTDRPNDTPTLLIRKKQFIIVLFLISQRDHNYHLALETGFFRPV